MIPREISGPQEQFERSGAQSLRDVRPLSTRAWTTLMSEFSGAVLLLGAGAMFFEPALVDLIVPAALGYTALVLSRRVELPMRLPKSSGLKDWNHPDPKNRRPRKAEGVIYLGRDIKGKELWISAGDARRHATIPGTTGAGKTTAIISFLCNALTHASGFVLVDGKADSELFGEVMALARRFGREDDVLHLNLLVASGSRESHSFNPFATGNAEQIREMVVSQLGEQSANDSNGVFRSRAVALIGAVIPVLTWIRDNKGFGIDIEKIRDALELRVIWKLAVKGDYEVRDPLTGRTRDQPIDLPQDVAYPLRAYLGELPGYDTDLDYNKQRSDDPSKQHGYARFYFTEMFTQLGVSLGHIFKVANGDIDMRDVVLNRRILLVSLPDLENSSDTLAGLGKIVVTSVRGMMAQVLSTPRAMLGPEAPYPVVFDEVSSYATSDLARMLRQGRSLNISFWLGFQDLASIYAVLGERTDTLTGNALLNVVMQIQDANRTRKWIEDSAGMANVAQATSYRGGDIGEYHDTRDADVRQVSRIDWRDLQGLIEGEAIVQFGNKRIYAKVFHAEVDRSGPKRLVRPVALELPDRKAIEAHRSHIRAIADRLEKGAVAAGEREPRSATLQAMYEGFAKVIAKRGDGRACVAAAIQAAGRIPHSGGEAQGLRGRFASVLEAGIAGTPGPQPLPAAESPGAPARTSDEKRAAIVEIDMAMGASPSAAQRMAVALVAGFEGARRALDAAAPKITDAAKFRVDVETVTRAILAEAESEKAEPGIRRHMEASP